MSEEELGNYLHGRTESLLQKFRKSKAKYDLIWEKYASTFPKCIGGCQKFADERNEGYREGPQGIYWIGESPKLMFVGKENFGWYGKSEWPRDKKWICYAALEFLYYDVRSMSDYWGFIKSLTQDVFPLSVDEKGWWEHQLKNIAITNASKCYSDYKPVLNNFHDRCLQQGFLKFEIEVVNPKVVVLFTRSINLLKRIYSDLHIIRSDPLFVIAKRDGMTLIECAHPGRQSKDWKVELKGIVSSSLNDIEEAKSALSIEKLPASSVE